MLSRKITTTFIVLAILFLATIQGYPIAKPSRRSYSKARNALILLLLLVIMVQK